ncbi:MAG: BlaI/MecI/CopY family transcriptional regulator [Candidatus Kerfeldbacteria bacterium]
MHESRLTLLGDLERAIMEAVWSRSDVTVRDVIGELKGSRRSAYTTVMTVMNRLVKKGLLRRKQRGTSFRYSAIQTKCAYLCECSRNVVDTFVHCYGNEAVPPLAEAIGKMEEKKAVLRPRTSAVRERRD